MQVVLPMEYHRIPPVAGAMDEGSRFFLCRLCEKQDSESAGAIRVLEDDDYRLIY
ncbi:MAG: hypothetical protein K9N48_04345 [Verrucomicrobia bacterium]|nr:hypothetical protein [Verrucomicrobiota bacterium]MCF7709031.1 hypothetical protein [Verrucomicrobiota bacterium]